MDSSLYLICSWVAAISFLTILATLLFMVYKKNRSVTASFSPPNWKHQSYCEPSLHLVEMEPSLDSDEGNMDNCEPEQRLEAFISRFNSELRKQRQEHIITNEDLKEKLYTSERASQGSSSGGLPAVYIYCANTLQYSFASHLSMGFHRKGIYASANSNETLDVMEGASASVVVFSKNYLSSPSCLDKLVRVLQCRRKSGQLVVPVFYDVSPSNVEVQEQESVDRISALQELREFTGYQFREGCSECELVEEIVKDVYEKLLPAEQIGISLRLLEIEHLLCKQPWGIRRLGIWGMPGIGKTTLAKAVFDQISGGYEAFFFIKHFDKAFNEKGLHCLLEEHFGNILMDLPRVCSSITRPSFPGDILSKKRTLVVLDDVQNPLVAESFLGGFHWFGPGSLIIITSRDKQVFRHCQINHVYEVQSLNENEALQLFSHHAIGENIREKKFMKLSMEVIDYASGNPLALSYYGKELKGKKLSEMRTTFLKHKLRTPYKIQDLFKRSYEALNDSEKNIFLDIACFFKGENVDYVMQLLEGCGFLPHIGIDVLVEKCLVTISENRVKMHRIIQDFGREIINGEVVQIERRRRLWEPWTIKFLLEDDKLKANVKSTYTRPLGTVDIEGIFLDASNLSFDVKSGAFKHMLSLRFLKIYCSSYEKDSRVLLPKGLDSLPYELRLLHWENYPLKSLPQKFDPCHLVELNLSYSQLQKLWGGTKNLKMLKVVRLCHSQQLTDINDLCKAQDLELLDLQGCTQLQSFPAMGQLRLLRVVNLSGCTEIRSFPEVSPNIKELHLQGTGIRELPVSTVTLSSQVKLNRELSNLLTEFPGVSDVINHERLTSLIKPVSANQHLGKLVRLNMKDCVHLTSLPDMADLELLQVLDLSGCSNLNDIQGFPRNLEELYLAGTAIKEFPQLPLSLEILNAHGCVSLISIPIGFEQLPRYYTFSNCFGLSEKVVNIFVKNALTNVERLAREYHQQQKLNKSLAFSFIGPSPAGENLTFDMQPGSSVIIQLGSSWRDTLGVAVLVQVTFSKDYCEASGGFNVTCVCRWKDKDYVSHKREKDFHCWPPEEEGVSKDHTFVFCDLDIHPGACEENDTGILADLVVFEFFTVNKQKKLLDESCTVTKCGVYVITAADRDTSPNMTPSFDYLQELSDNDARNVYDGLDEDERTLFLYIACLFNDEEAYLLAPLSNGLEISSGIKILTDKSLIHISPYGVLVREGLLQKIGMEMINRRRQAQALTNLADIAGVDSRKWDNNANMIENLPHSFKMHSSMCLALKKLVDRVMKIFPEIEAARPGSSTAIQPLNEALEKAKLLLQYCSESSKLYMAVTGDDILTRGSRSKKLLEQSLADIRTMVPTALAIQILEVLQDLKSTELSLESSEEEAGKDIRELMRQSTSSSVSSDEIRDFHFAALKLQLSTPEAVAVERRSLKSLYGKLGECEGNKRQILKYLLCLLKKHEKIIWRDHKDNSLTLHQSSNDSVCAGVADAGCSEEYNATLPEHFKCPLSLTVMYDPVIISSGHTFERMSIQKWFECNDSCPVSKRILDDFTLQSNVAMKDQISKWCSKKGLDVQDPAMKHVNASHNLDFSIPSFSSPLYNISDLSCFRSSDISSSFSTESETEIRDSTHSEWEIEPLCELSKLPWNAQVKVVQDVRSLFEQDSKAARSMSPSKFIEPLVTFLKNAHERNGTDVVKDGLELLLTFLSGNRRAIDSLGEEVFEMLCVFLGSELVAEETLNVLEVLSNHPHSLSKITSTGSLSCLLKIAESGAENLQEQAMITLKKLCSSNEICLEMVSLGFVQKLTSFLQQNVFSKHSIIMLKNLCNTEKGRVCVTETPGCLASISDLLDSNVSEEVENAISILLQLCVEKIEYCYLVVREGLNIYSSLLLISNNGTEEAKVGASELLRALEEVEEVEEEEESSTPQEEATTSQVVTHQEPITKPSPKNSGLFGLSFSISKKKIKL
ncbi:disease resistance protein RRS1 isoform X1 [Brassica rapa]|uniref:disease resistance protein RRS1 isoform X1 n=2 Tax=Brassica campestris TaxID=3711 RepID=UPI00142E1A42|nr:disease resistance protein RRS1 isoform X1 [Brassica rapa]XP_033132963.1 disease resistance protein RRS1 isoform X1 [Brassica rapa]